MNLSVKTSDLVGRDTQLPDVGAMSGPASALFSLPKGGVSGPINEGPNGIVAQVVDKREPTPEELAKNLPATREKLLDQQRQEAFGLFAASLLQRYQQNGGVVYSRKQPAGLP
jgi:peptidyl-prolyl cis-trans isomerase D